MSISHNNITFARVSDIVSCSTCFEEKSYLKLIIFGSSRHSNKGWVCLYSPVVTGKSVILTANELFIAMNEFFYLCKYAEVYLALDDIQSLLLYW